MLYTIGFTQKTAEQFFGLIQDHKITRLIDVRLWNSTQLAGFSKGRDLQYFLSTICGCKYAHERDAAPSKELLDGYKSGAVTWTEYEEIYHNLMRERGTIDKLAAKYDFADENIILLCAEPTALHCHRRLLAELLAQNNPAIEIQHITPAATGQGSD